jgi:hypothetical protein
MHRVCPFVTDVSSCPDLARITNGSLFYETTIRSMSTNQFDYILTALFLDIVIL